MQATRTNQAFIIFFSIIAIALIYLLASILTPFLLGAFFAYLANPLVEKLEKRKVPHLLAVTIIFLLIFGSLALIILLLTPVIEDQVSTLIDTIPTIFDWVQQKALPWLQQFVKISTIKETVTNGISKTPTALNIVINSGYAIIGWIVNIVLIPIVTFYLLRDWHDICARITKLIPKSAQTTVLPLVHECDEVLSVFFRGQLLVVIALGFIYGIGLTLIGLKAGLVIGLIGGLLSIVPYLGSTFIVVFASLAAIVQSPSMEFLSLVWLVFFIGQALEGYVLIPYLIGTRMGLHPVVVIFAVMAGGTLFGFFGVLLALPMAAVIKVLLGFVNKRYLHLKTT